MSKYAKNARKVFPCPFRERIWLKLSICCCANGHKANLTRTLFTSQSEVSFTAVKCTQDDFSLMNKLINMNVRMLASGNSSSPAARVAQEAINNSKISSFSRIPPFKHLRLTTLTWPHFQYRRNQFPNLMTSKISFSFPCLKAIHVWCEKKSS